ncbi:MAG: thiamine phosphate synthase [Muribaculum sp.]|nr:thiamine phosphate synthase [Muribaculaceae bacterium]MCM1081554.1 thiamine phosphate synthase [Muribaculum sp.]
MRIIVITSPEVVPGETGAIVQLLDSGAVWRVHLRRPSADEETMRKLIDAIPAEFHSRLSLHSHFNLAKEYGIGGLHLNHRSPTLPEGFKGLVSTSCHSIDDICRYPAADYMFFSPVFNSISKPGYKAAFSAEQLRQAVELAPNKLYALGGITPELLPEVKRIGFEGAAMLGYVWNCISRGDINEFIDLCFNS